MPTPPDLLAAATLLRERWREPCHMDDLVAAIKGVVMAVDLLEAAEETSHAPGD